MDEHSQIPNPAAQIAQVLLILAISVAVIGSALWMNLDAPYLAFATASAFLFHLRARPGWRELLLAILIASALAMLRVLFIPGHPRDLAGFVAAMAGLGSFLVLGIRAARADKLHRKRLFCLLGPALGLVFFIFSAQRALNLADLLYPKTFDLYLYAFDGSFGFQPSFAMGRLFEHSAIANTIGFLAYQTLPLVMALVYVGYINPKATKPVWYLLELFFLAGLLGWVFYNFVPGTGPVYAFAGLFPDKTLPYHILRRLLLERISVDGAYPRNAIPSLHVAWVLLLWWSCRRFSPWIRAAAFLYLIATIMGTMGTGEHYFIDLVVAVPFALLVEAICQSAIPFRKRLLPLLTGLGLTLAWLTLVRFGTALVLKSRTIPWILAVLSTAAVFWVEHRRLGIEAPAEPVAPAPQLAAAAAH